MEEAKNKGINGDSASSKQEKAFKRAYSHLENKIMNNNLRDVFLPALFNGFNSSADVVRVDLDFMSGIKLTAEDLISTGSLAHEYRLWERYTKEVGIFSWFVMKDIGYRDCQTVDRLVMLLPAEWKTK